MGVGFERWCGFARKLLRITREQSNREPTSAGALFWHLLVMVPKRPLQPCVKMIVVRRSAWVRLRVTELK